MKLKKKTRKQLKRVMKQAGRLGGVFAVSMLTEMAAAFLERGDALAGRAESLGRLRASSRRDDAVGVSQH
jgi:hypothetical protein